ncbi:uncharacterized protein zgc:113263 isoform X2 [Cheilinus undulatus]|uniref:uncharacterized protein zgc:113263 isoform X2 n=1 Tax=Cheilinus undulatus TaxID=241271 RepID=UPI001BD461EF|nr:uncharacterized protein zgc:113263 isoform X2 [Cheilinus undulatus]
MFNLKTARNDPPVQYLRLLAPPLQLLSAAVWQVVQQGLVDHYGMLEEFVTMVTELVPELMSYSQRAQLILGLRARLVLEMCRGEHPADMQTIQPHLDRIKAPVSTAKDHHVTINQVEESEVNFVELVHSLLEDPSERNYFFEEIFPVYFGPKYDAALEMLVWEFISRLEELLPVPDFTQMAAFLRDSPSFLDDCLQTSYTPEDMKAVLEHHRNLGHFKDKVPRLLPMDDCILSSLSLPPGSKPPTDIGSCSPAFKDANPPEHQEHLTRQQLKETRAPDSQERDSRTCDETIDLTTSNETVDSDSAASDNSHSLRGGRVLRKRKASGGVDIPSKQPVDAAAFLNPSLEDENSGESPLISIWGDYTDSQEGSLPVLTDSKVPWSDEETLHLLDIWGKDSIQRALKGCLKNRHIFTQIAQKMAERGYMRSVEQCQTRIKRLKKCFRQNNKGSSRLEFKFYEQLQRILDSTAPSAVPEVTYDVEEVYDEERSLDGNDDLQYVSQTSRLEIGTRSVPWTDLETLTLINTWSEDRMQKQLRGIHRTGHIFSVISNKMAAQGFSRTPDQCQTRMKRLRSSFRQCYQNNISGQEPVLCKFYNELGSVLVKDFQSVLQMEEMPSEEPEDNDTPSFSEPDTESAVGGQEDRKKVPWSDKETIILLELWGDQQVQQSIRRYPHNGHLFTEISEKLNANGYSRTPEQCHTRIKRLKSNYRQCRENMSSSGPDRVDFKFYDLLEQILEKQPSTSSMMLTDSIEISEDSNSEVAEADGDINMSTEKPATGSWSDDETLTLIEIWGVQDVQRALRGFVHNGHVYAEISERMQELGYFKTPEQCRWKVKSLRNNFRQCYDRKKCGKKVDYRFYNQMEQILGQEAVSMDEYDERDEQPDLDPESSADGVNTAWTEQETCALVEVWAADDVQYSLKACVRNGHIFADIADRLTSMGYPRNAEQCQSRIKRLKKAYRRFCNSRRSGRPSAFRYFHLLAPVLGDRSMFNDQDLTPADSILPPIMDMDPDIYDQPSSSQLLTDLSKKTPWSEKETRTLLEIWGDDGVQITLRGSQKNRHVFEYISEKMSDQGFIRTSEQCYTRIKRLKHGFLHEREEFKFFPEMDKIFRKEPEVDEPLAETSVPDDMEDYEAVSSQKKGTQWTPESSKLVWGDGETEALLDIWGSEEIQEGLKSCTKNKHIFIQISEVMNSQGYMRTPEQCQTRIKRLRANFRQFLEGRKGDKQECKYFDQLVRVFGSKYVINNDPLADDMTDVLET